MDLLAKSPQTLAMGQTTQKVCLRTPMRLYKTIQFDCLPDLSQQNNFQLPRLFESRCALYSFHAFSKI
jgi:hypothetical protein